MSDQTTASSGVEAKSENGMPFPSEIDSDLFAQMCQKGFTKVAFAVQQANSPLENERVWFFYNDSGEVRTHEAQKSVSNSKLPVFRPNKRRDKLTTENVESYAKKHGLTVSDIFEVQNVLAAKVTAQVGRFW